MHVTTRPYHVPDAMYLRSVCSDRILRWYDYAEAPLNFPLGKVLDYGCGTGVFLERIANRCEDRWGVDVDDEKLELARGRTDAHLERILPGHPMPLPDGTFDTVVIMEVIEHVAEERAVLEELSRVLPPGGRLLLTTPHKGLLTFIDPGNFKFIALCRLHHRSPWHRHYSYDRIRALVPAMLETVAWAVYSPAFRAFSSLQLVLRVVTFGWVQGLPQALQWASCRVSRVQSRWGDQLIILFEKRGADGGRWPTCPQSIKASTLGSVGKDPTVLGRT